ncbi:MAG: hypothetical protein PVJ89_11730 [Planctomycetota bacterium]|jgi:hypothetical protein
MHHVTWLIAGLAAVLSPRAEAASPLVPQEPSPVKFEELDLESATSRAERLEKFLVILWVQGPDSPATLAFRDGIFSDTGVRSWLEQNAVTVRIDADVDRKGARKAVIKRYPCVDIIDFVRGGRVGRLIRGDNAFDFLATVYGAASDPTEAKKPTGEEAKEPFRWLAWANARARAGTNEGTSDAVNGYTWCLRRADDHRPGFRARYLEFLQERIASAKMQAPEAVDILLAESNLLAERMLAGAGTRQTAYDFVRVNKWRRKELETRDLFMELRGRGEAQEQARAWLFADSVAALGRYQQYEEINSFVGDRAVELFASRIASLQALTADAAPEEGEEGPEVVPPLPYSVPDTRGVIIEQASWVFEAQLAAGRGEDARALFELVIEHYPIARSFGLFMERALRLELWKFAGEIGDIGMGTLDAKGQKRMERLLQRIPPPEDDGSDR